MFVACRRVCDLVYLRPTLLMGCGQVMPQHTAAREFKELVGTHMRRLISTDPPVDDEVSDTATWLPGRLCGSGYVPAFVATAAIRVYG